MQIIKVHFGHLVGKHLNTLFYPRWSLVRFFVIMYPMSLQVVYLFCGFVMASRGRLPASECVYTGEHLAY